MIRPTTVLKAVESGMDYEMVRTRLADLKASKQKIRGDLSIMEVSMPLKLTKEHIKYFLDQFRNEDYADRNCKFDQP